MAETLAILTTYIANMQHLLHSTDPVKLDLIAGHAGPQSAVCSCHSGDPDWCRGQTVDGTTYGCLLCFIDSVAYFFGKFASLPVGCYESKVFSL